MGTPILNGSDEPAKQFWEQDFSRWNSGASTLEFKGYNIAKMSALAQSYYNAGWRGKLRLEKNLATLTLQSSDMSGGTGGSWGGGGGSGAITDKWEISVDQEKPDLLDNDNFLSYATAADGTFTGLSQQICQLIRRVASSDNPTWGGFKAAADVAVIVDSSGAPIAGQTISANFSISTIRNWVQDYFRGATNYVRGKYTVRHTTLAPNNYAANVADFNVCRIYTISQLLTELQSTSLWILPLPSYLAYKINAYPVPSYQPANFMFGALKMRSPAVLAALGRIEITTEYLIDTWPIHTYGTAS